MSQPLDDRVVVKCSLEQLFILADFVQNDVTHNRAVERVEIPPTEGIEVIEPAGLHCQMFHPVPASLYSQVEMVHASSSEALHIQFNSTADWLSYQISKQDFYRAYRMTAIFKVSFRSILPKLTFLPDKLNRLCSSKISAKLS